MFIKKLAVQNFKSYQDVQFDFHPKINVLTGVNNSGKTTVLEAIALWHECYGRLVRKAGGGVRGKYTGGDYIPGTSNPHYVSYHDINSVRSPFYEDVFHNLEKNPKKPVHLAATLCGNDSRELELNFILSVADGDNYKIWCANYNTFDFSLFNDSKFISNPETAFQLTYASPISTVLPTEERHLRSKIEHLKKCRLSGQVFRNRLELLRDRRNGDFERFLSELKLVLTNGINDVSIDFSNDRSNLNTIVKIRIGKEDFKDISLLGSGTLQVIEILLSLFEEKRDLNIILLDEPDSHVHHALQNRLLETFEKFTDNSQVFLTTHNEALVRAAKHEWVFHLEQQTKAHYKPIIHTPIQGIKKGIQPTGFTPVIRDLRGAANSLDFIYALEADKLILVEGEDDAIRIQRLLSLKINGKTKYAFWAAGGVAAYFSRIGVMKEIFKNIRNNQNLWEKSTLIMDKDCMTDAQRQQIISKFSSQLGIKTQVWESYNFESILLSDPDKLSELLLRFLASKNINPLPSKPEIKSKLEVSMSSLLTVIKVLYESDPELNQIFGELKTRREQLGFQALGINISGVFEEDKDLKMNLLNYFQTCFSVQEMHKICRKEHFEKIILETLSPHIPTFSIETDFDDLLNLMDTSTWINGYDFILGL